MPRGLVRLLAPEVAARTVQQEGWSGLRNGRLLTAASASFDALVMTDWGIPHQQNLERYAVGVVLLTARSNRLQDLAPLVPAIKACANEVAPEGVLRIG